MASHTWLARHGIHRLELPLPFGLGSVNAWVIDDDPLTLVDAGPATDEARTALESGLRRLGHDLADVGLVVLTHEHWDHAGGAAHVVRRSGARLAASRLLEDVLARQPERATAEGRYGGALLRRHGFAEELARVSEVGGEVIAGCVEPCTVTEPLADGDLLELRDRTLKVLHRPGHSLADLVLWDPQDRVLLAGDHLLADVASNPLLGPPLPCGPDDAAAAAAAARRRQLVAYKMSTAATATLPARFVAPGHGAPFTGHDALIERRLQQFERREGLLLAALADGPRTAQELAAGLWGQTASRPGQAYLTLCSTLGHLDALALEGCVREEATDRGASFTRTRVATASDRLAVAA